MVGGGDDSGGLSIRLVGSLAQHRALGSRLHVVWSMDKFKKSWAKRVALSTRYTQRDVLIP